jgi:predicted phage terminase large subunit-like protein
MALTAQERIDAERMRRNFRLFVGGAWHIVEPATPMIGGFHIDAICEHLEHVSNGDIRKLIVNVPPRHMKSLLTSVFWPAWEWISMPHTRWLFASYAQKLAIDHSVLCRRVILSDWYRERWGGVFSLEEDENQKTSFENNRTGRRIATSVGGTATGLGGDRLVYDDPHNANETESDVIREGVIEWFDGTMATRKNDPKKSAEVIIMQRLHEEDLTGHVLAQEDDWELLCLPAEYEPERCKLTTGWVDPREEEGELLWEEQMGTPELSDRKKRLGSYKYAGQFQQNPVPSEGGILKKPWWNYYRPGHLPQLQEILQSWDLSFKDTDGSDYVVGQIWGRDLGNKYLIRSYRRQASFVETVRMILKATEWVEETFPNFKSHPKLIEEAANGSAVLSALKRRVPGMIPIQAEISKEARAHAVSPEIEAGNVFVPGEERFDGLTYDNEGTPLWVQEFIDECAAFPKAKNDDQVDACTQALNRMAGRGGGESHVRTGGYRSTPVT